MGWHDLNGNMYFRILIFVFILLAGACSEPVKTPPPYAEKKLPPSDMPSLNRVFSDLTGYGLGDPRLHQQEENFGKCVAAGRFGKVKDGKVVQIFCFSHTRNAPKDPRTRYWVSFTPPEKEHRVWRVEISVPEKKISDLSLVSDLKRNIGVPQRRELPLTLSWRSDSTHLTVKEDDYGTHFLLWDRSLR